MVLAAFFGGTPRANLRMMGSSANGVIRASWRRIKGKVDAGFPLLHLQFCLDCPNPSMEGSLEVVYAVPNDCRSELLNADDVPGRIILVERGEVPILEKIIRAQDAGAAGVIVVDDGGCSPDLRDCGRLGGVRDGGFAGQDGKHAWAAVTIPAVMIAQETGKRLRGMMGLRLVLVAGLGEQLVIR